MQINDELYATVYEFVISNRLYFRKRLIYRLHTVEWGKMKKKKQKKLTLFCLSYVF